MSTPNHKPVIFLAFANVLDGTVAYLHNLPEEQRQIRAALERARTAGLCDVIERYNATTQDILDVFQHPEYRNRIAIFHYGGHADGFQLLLESPEGKVSPAYAGGFAAFLEQQRGLQLVFLNGCSTQPQARGLLEANIKVVIATSQDIRDDIATELAVRFYTGLASGANIRIAYNEAVASISTEIGDDWLNYYRSDASEELRWPWDLYLKAGADAADQWNLPQAVNDPLFGLPELQRRDLPRKPYRHLHWFRRDDAEIFFGRGHQIRKLYELVAAPDAAPIILLYGQSGVGKSSLLEAGLMPRLEQDAVICYDRRNQEIGLLETLQNALPVVEKPSSLKSAWLGLEKKRGKPVVIIIDQVEEVYTRPQPSQSDELQNFLAALQDTFADFHSRPQGKLILGFRKEWLAEIETRLNENKLAFSRVFLERLDRQGIIEAITGPARATRLLNHYGLRITDGLAEIIADDLLADRDSPIAPTLQILLTKMWDEAAQQNRSHPHFDHDLYNNLKKQGILLQDFLNQQLEALRNWQPEVVESGLALDVLAFHTTPLGSAEQRTAEQLAQEYRHRQDVLPELVQKCKDLYLLVDPAADQAHATATRLTHDTLAPLVRKQFDDSDKPGQRSRRILENRSVEWRDGQQGTPLDERDLVVVEQGEKGMRAWKSDEQRLIEASRKKRAQNQRRRKIFWSIGIAALVLIVLAAGLALLKSKAEQRQARISVARSLANDAQGMRSSYPQLSLLLAIEAIQVAWRADEPHTSSAENALRASLSAMGGYGIAGHEGAITAVAISADNHWLVTGSADSTIRLWDLTIQNPADKSIVLSGHNAAITAVAISADNHWLVTGSVDNTIRLWDLTIQNPADKSIVLLGHNAGITAVAISADNHWLVTGSADSTVRLWDLATKNPAANSITLPSQNDRITAVGIDASGPWQVTTGTGRITTKQWDLTVKNPMFYRKELSGCDCYNISASAISADNHLLVTARTNDMTARLWDLTAKNPAANPVVLSGHEANITAVAISADNHWLVTGSDDKTVRLWDLTAKNPALNPIVLSGHEAGISAVAISADNHWLVAGSSDHTTRLWDLTTKNPVVLYGHRYDITAVAISPDNHWLVTCSMDSTARLWDLTAKNPTANPIVLSGHFVGRTIVAISANSRWLFTGSFLGTAPRLWDLSAKNPTASPIVLDDVSGITAVAISADNHWLVTGQFNMARLWDLTAPSSIANPVVLSGHKEPINAVAISADNHWLVSGSQDNTVRLWDLTSKNPAAYRCSLGPQKCHFGCCHQCGQPLVGDR